MNFKSIILSLLVLSLSTQSFGYIFKIDVLEKDGQRIYLMSDRHIKKDTDNQQIRETIQIIDKLHGFTILEGMYGICKDIEFLKPLLDLPEHNDFINQFDRTYFRNLTPKKINVEFRKSANLFLNDISPITHILDEIEEKLEQISKYNDGEILNDLYKKIIRELRQRIQIIKDYKHYKSTDYMKDFSLYQKTSKYVTNFLCIESDVDYDTLHLIFITLIISSHIMEAEILHILHKNKKENHIFIILGGIHNVTLEDILIKLLRYKKIKSLGEESNSLNFDQPPTYQKPINIKKFFDELETETSKKPILAKL